MVALYWFRKALRLHDNPSLVAALEGSTTTLYPVFCLDPHFVKSGRVGFNRMRFLLETLADLDCSLRSRNSRLVVLQGAPAEVLPHAFAQWNVKRLAYEIDTEVPLPPPPPTSPHLPPPPPHLPTPYPHLLPPPPPTPHRQPYAKQRDLEINRLAADAGVQVLFPCCHTHH